MTCGPLTRRFGEAPQGQNAHPCQQADRIASNAKADGETLITAEEMIKPSLKA
ncbi:hypothetical protein [Suttonella indologenes]|uniref:hypothetical protein n=1 Tax=Suttonella indologenes TaxID=13276 RepID=UPI001559F1E0|nr:hypothetical protein [Suttonella indologenes]